MKKKLSKRGERSFGDLPPRVIIHDILTCYEFEISEEITIENGRHCLFGYFKRDRSRNIWFVFSSLLVRKSRSFTYSNVHFPFICVSKLFHIDLTIIYGIGHSGNECVCCHIFENMIEHSQQMYSLRSVEFRKSLFVDESLKKTKISTKITKDLFKGIHFPNLKSFKLQWDSESEEFECFSKLSHCVFSSLEVFEIDYLIWNTVLWKRNTYRYEGIGIGTILRRERGKLKNLRILRILRLRFENEVHLNLPRLRKLTTGAENLRVTTGGELRFLKLLHSPKSLDSWISLVSESPKMACLDIRCGGQTTCWFLELDPGFHGFPDLKILKIGSGSKFNHNSLHTWNMVRNQLEEVSIHFRSFVELRILSIFHLKEYKSLRKLEVQLGDSHILYLGTLWPFSQNLRDLDISSIHSGSLDPLFQKNEFPNLEKLSVDGCFCSTSGKDWRKFSSLKSLSLDILESVSSQHFFRDSFFIEHDELGNLTDLKIAGLSITGIGWNKVFFDNLKVLEIANCSNLEKKSFFEENEFRRIEKLILDHKDLTFETDEERKNLVEKLFAPEISIHRVEMNFPETFRQR